MSGEGMKAFYDRILKQFTEKYIKKWGSKVGVVELPEVEEAGREMWGFDVTPAMKAAVMGRGQPLFQSPTRSSVDLTGADKDVSRAFPVREADKLYCSARYSGYVEGYSP